jgi:hypothetical protein
MLQNLWKQKRIAATAVFTSQVPKPMVVEVANCLRVRLQQKVTAKLGTRKKLNTS